MHSEVVEDKIFLLTGRKSRPVTLTHVSLESAAARGKRCPPEQTGGDKTRLHQPLSIFNLIFKIKVNLALKKKQL